MNNKIKFAGIEFDHVSHESMESWISERTESCPFEYLVTPNVDHVVRFQNAPDCVRSAYLQADKCVCDSRILRKLGLLVGVGLDVVTGSDLVEVIFKNILKPGDRVCLIGATDLTYRLLEEKFPHLEIFHHEAPMNLVSNVDARTEAIEFASNAKARLILLAVGSPQQEMLAHEMKSRPGMTGTALCIGAGVEFLVGSQKRAPIAIRNANLEWAWRLIKEPRRLAHRYLVRSPAIFPVVFKWWWVGRHQ